MRARRASIVRACAALVVIAGATVSSGCFHSPGTIDGGGWFSGGGPSSKATVGVTLDCVLPQPGSISFVDRATSLGGTRVSFTASITACSGADGSISGSYAARPKGAGGTISGTFTDGGMAGPSKGDRFTFCLTGGRFNDYCFNEALAGGNLTLAY